MMEEWWGKKFELNFENLTEFLNLKNLINFKIFP